MRKATIPLALWLACGVSSAFAQVNVQIDIGLPVAPRLVVVQPGIQVVEGFQEEVFFRGGWYWCRRPDGWYRSRSPRARFIFVEPRRVPPPLIQIPEGHYRNWHRHQPRHHEIRQIQQERREIQQERREIRRERRELKQDQRELRRDQRETRRDRREDRREERRDDRRNEPRNPRRP